MLRKLSLTLFLISSGCVSGPKIRVNISDPQKGGMDWADSRVTPNTGFTPYLETENFVCFTPSDAQLLLNYCKAPK